MKIKYLLFISIYITIVGADNVGWDSYLIDNPTEFHDLPLVWEFGNDTTVPSWLSGVYVRNGPAQVIYATSLFNRATLDMKNHKPTTTYQKLSIF